MWPLRVKALKTISKKQKFLDKFWGILKPLALKFGKTVFGFFNRNAKFKGVMKRAVKWTWKCRLTSTSIDRRQAGKVQSGLDEAMDIKYYKRISSCPFSTGRRRRRHRRRPLEKGRLVDVDHLKKVVVDINHLKKAGWSHGHLIL